MIQIEFQVRDRLSFMCFLQFSVGDIVPDAKAIRFFGEELTEAGLVTKLFKQFDKFLSENGFSAKKGQIVDAGIVAAPKQRNSRDENKTIKNGNIRNVGKWALKGRFYNFCGTKTPKNYQLKTGNFAS